MSQAEVIEFLERRRIKKKDESFWTADAIGKKLKQSPHRVREALRKLQKWARIERVQVTFTSENNTSKIKRAFAYRFRVKDEKA